MHHFQGFFSYFNHFVFRVLNYTHLTIFGYTEENLHHRIIKTQTIVVNILVYLFFSNLNMNSEGWQLHSSY